MPLLLALAFLAGCNTVQGMGQDIKKGGQVIETAARDISNKM
ncbi:entericidin A/B family lipoprotein [Craterilacuibacter sp.]